MTDKTCRLYGCNRPVGTQDRDDYNGRLFCSVQCEVKHDKRRHDAREARQAEREAAERRERRRWYEE